MKHRRLDLAEMTGRKLIEFDPDHEACQMFMPATGRLCHERIHGVWRVRKPPGCSLLDHTSGACHRFIAQDKSHPSSD